MVWRTLCVHAAPYRIDGKQKQKQTSDRRAHCTLLSCPQSVGVFDRAGPSAGRRQAFRASGSVRYQRPERRIRPNGVTWVTPVGAGPPAQAWDAPLPGEITLGAVFASACLLTFFRAAEICGTSYRQWRLLNLPGCSKPPAWQRRRRERERAESARLNRRSWNRNRWRRSRTTRRRGAPQRMRSRA